MKRILPNPPLFRDRPLPFQIVLGGVIPFAVGVLAGVLLGASKGAYLAIGLLAAVGAFLSGFEHVDGWEGADRGFFGGIFYGIGLLAAHAVIDNHPKTSIPSFRPLLVVLTAIVGMFLAAAGGSLAYHFGAREHVSRTAED
jgi:hypothetical protein